MFLELFKAIFLYLVNQFVTAAGHDAAILQDMHDIRPDIFKKLLVVGDDDRRLSPS